MNLRKKIRTSDAYKGTPYEVAINCECLTPCKFTGARIGSIECAFCTGFISRNKDSKTVICREYRKEFKKKEK